MLVRELSPRERAVVLLVGRLSQASTMHIKPLLFDTVSRVSMDRTLRRLVASKHLVMVGRRASGPKGGTGSGVYALGSKGWWYCGKQGKYWGFRAVSEHTLSVADLFTTLVLMDKDAAIRLLPDTTLEKTVGHQRADMYLDAAVPVLGKRRRYYVEVQMSARPDVIRKKLRGYWDTYSSSSDERWPRVVFVVFDEWHQHEIKRMIPKHMRELFQVQLASEFIEGVTKP